MVGKADVSGIVGQEDKYEMLAEIVVSDLFFAKTLSFIVDQAEYDSLAVALVNISIEGGNTLSIIREIVASEFERNFRSPGSILRGNCVASKMMGAFSRRVGGDYIREVIGPHVNSIAKDKSLSLEIDPIKLKSESELPKNTRELNKRAADVIDKITDMSMVDKMPQEIKAMAGFTAEYAKIYCPDRLSPLIGGFIMLRLFNPSLVTPESLKILPKDVTLTREARRNLTLITKILQNLSNSVKFGSKETFMLPMNDFLENKQGDMNAYLNLIAQLGQEVSSKLVLSNKSSHLKFSNLKEKDLELLHQLLYNYKDKILSYLSIEVSKHPDKAFDREELLFQILDELGPPKRSRRARGQDNDGVLFLTPPEKSGYLNKKLKERTHLLGQDYRRRWVVLTRGFLHFFSSPESTIPDKSISLEDVVVMEAEKGAGVTPGVYLSYHRKEHLYVTQDNASVEMWVAWIKKIKQKYAKTEQREVTGTLRPIEIRIRNHTMGLKVSYNVSLSSDIEYGAGNLIYFSLEVTVFSTKIHLKKTLSEWKSLHEKLTAAFPKIIFPTYPSGIGESPGDKLPFGQFNGRASYAVNLMRKFVRSLLHEIRHNLTVHQSKEMLDFYELTCPIKMVERNETEILQNLLQISVDFNKHDINGYTALHKAVELNQEESVRWLCKCSSVHINSKDNDGNSPLLLALELGNLKLFQILIDAGAEVKITNNNRTTPLHIAASNGFVDQCKILLDKGQKIDELNMEKESSLHLAFVHGRKEVVELLIERGSSLSYLDKYGNSLLSLASMYNFPDTIEWLLKKTTIPVDGRGRETKTPLHLAIDQGHHESVVPLLAHGARPMLKDDHQKSSLFLCIMTDYPCSIVTFQSLLEHCSKSGTLRVEGEYQGRRLVHFAAESIRGEQYIRLLSQYGVNLNSQDPLGRTSLNIASGCNNHDVVKTLLELGADGSITDKKLQTPLSMAVFKGYYECCETLLTHGSVDPNTFDRDGTTPLLIAIWTNRRKIVQLLVRHDADVNQPELVADGNFPLHLAVMLKHLDIALIVLKSGADINKQRAVDGFTALHCCVEGLVTTFAQFLAESPAQVFEIKNKQGETPLQMAINYNYPMMIKIIKGGE